MTDSTAKQLLELLQLDRTTVYRMLSEGCLPGFKVAGQWRFSRPEIDACYRNQQLHTVLPNGALLISGTGAVHRFLASAGQSGDPAATSSRMPC